MPSENFLCIFSFIYKGTWPSSKGVIPSHDIYLREKLHQKHIILQYLF